METPEIVVQKHIVQYTKIREKTVT